MKKNIEDIINSADELGELPVSKELMDRLSKIPDFSDEKYSKITSQRNWYFAIAIMLVLGLNATFIAIYGQQRSTETELSDDYFSYLNNL